MRLAQLALDWRAEEDWRDRWLTLPGQAAPALRSRLGSQLEAMRDGTGSVQFAKSTSGNSLAARAEERIRRIDRWFDLAGAVSTPCGKLPVAVVSQLYVVPRPDELAPLGPCAMLLRYTRSAREDWRAGALEPFSAWFDALADRLIRQRGTREDLAAVQRYTADAQGAIVAPAGAKYMRARKRGRFLT